MNRFLLTLTLFISTLVQAQDIKLNGVISAEYNQIKNLANPTEIYDAVTKFYVDNNTFSGNYYDLINKPTVFNGSFIGDLAGNLFGNVTGDVFGNLTGNVTGDLTGNVTGNVTGDVTSTSVITQMLKLVSLTDSEINSITPEEGMLIYNETARQLQIYSTVTPSISNTTFAGEFTNGDDIMNQSFVPHIAGDIISISVYGKRTEENVSYATIDFNGQNVTLNSNYWSAKSINSPAWHEFTFNTPITVNAGQNYTFRLGGPGTCGGRIVFATNFSYSQGSVSADDCGGTPVGFDNGKDLAFLITFANNTTQLGWLSIN